MRPPIATHPHWAPGEVQAQGRAVSEAQVFIGFHDDNAARAECVTDRRTQAFSAVSGSGVTTFSVMVGPEFPEADRRAPQWIYGAPPEVIVDWTA